MSLLSTHKKIIVVALAIAIILPNIALARPITNEVTFEDLKTKEPAILAGNPFYFLKNIKWHLKKLFINDQLKEFSLKQDLLAKKAAELLKIKKITKGKNHEPTLKALAEYQTSLLPYKIALKKFVGKSKKKNIDISQTSAQLITHLRLIYQIKNQDPNIKEKAFLVDIEDQLIQAIIITATELTTPKIFARNIENTTLKKNPAVWQKIAQTLNSLSKVLESQEEEKLDKALTSLENELISALNHWLKTTKDNDLKKEVIQLISS